jgi:hypothetical protein
MRIAFGVVPRALAASRAAHRETYARARRASSSHRASSRAVVVIGVGVASTRARDCGSVRIFLASVEAS